ncbi:hypothetical protein O181_007112 [Austropuccinia psidii MF-1]|uniref:LSM2-LSM8 complex subunit LSM8 n=1 Tax=Austropuccinia psidii MF-1 TaxID=1389203 RepID=A0A9Q3GI62_9BASI|nr:hypothetical protein [Austropuccinia psidii MF-1]
MKNLSTWRSQSQRDNTNSCYQLAPFSEFRGEKLFWPGRRSPAAEVAGWRCPGWAPRRGSDGSPAGTVVRPPCAGSESLQSIWASNMSSKIADYLDKRVLVITQDGRTISGELKGFDQTTNIILSDSIERVYSSEEPMEEVPLGLYIVRGDHISIIGELDIEADQKIDWGSIRAEPLDEIRH